MAWNVQEFGKTVIPALTARLTVAKTLAVEVSATPGQAGGTYNFVSPYVDGESRVRTSADIAAGNAFIFDSIVDKTTPIQLDGFVYKATALEMDFETFTIFDLKNIINGSATVCANGINKLTGALLQTEINAVTAGKTIALVADEGAAVKQILKALLSAKTTLDNAGVDTFSRTATVSSGVGELLLGSDQFSSADKAGTPDALREALIGRVYGFDVLIDNTLTGLGFVAYEKYAFGLIVRPKAASISAGVESTVSVDPSMVLSTTVAYNSGLGRDELVVGAFVGVGKLDPARSVAAKFTAAS
jgi:hypothetical protein